MNKIKISDRLYLLKKDNTTLEILNSNYEFITTLIIKEIDDNTIEIDIKDYIDSKELVSFIRKKFSDKDNILFKEKNLKVQNISLKYEKKLYNLLDSEIKETAKKLRDYNLSWKSVNWETYNFNQGYGVDNNKNHILYNKYCYMMKSIILEQRGNEIQFYDDGNIIFSKYDKDYENFMLFMLNQCISSGLIYQFEYNILLDDFTFLDTNAGIYKKLGDKNLYKINLQELQQKLMSIDDFIPITSINDFSILDIDEKVIAYLKEIKLEIFLPHLNDILDKYIKEIEQKNKKIQKKLEF